MAVPNNQQQGKNSNQSAADKAKQASGSPNQPPDTGLTGGTAAGTKDMPAGGTSATPGASSEGSENSGSAPSGPDTGSSAVIGENSGSGAEPTVPQPGAPSETFDPAHGGTIDTYPSEAAAAGAAGTHVDLTQTVKPVAVIAHQGAPLHRVDGKDAGTDVSTGDALAAAIHAASGGAVGTAGGSKDASTGAGRISGSVEHADDHDFVASMVSHVASGEMSASDADSAIMKRYAGKSEADKAKLKSALTAAATTADRLSQNASQMQ